MALKPCPECKKEVSDSATSCPHCGRKLSPKASPMFIGCGALIVLFVGYCTFAGGGGSNAPSSASVGSAPPAPAVQEEKLEVLKWTWGKSGAGGFAVAEGEVKNISSASIDNVMAVVTFRTASGEFITSDDALIDFRPLLAGQTSPFKVMATWNPEMKTAGLAFRQLLGGTIAHKER